MSFTVPVRINFVGPCPQCAFNNLIEYAHQTAVLLSCFFFVLSDNSDITVSVYEVT